MEVVLTRMARYDVVCGGRLPDSLTLTQTGYGVSINDEQKTNNFTTAEGMTHRISETLAMPSGTPNSAALIFKGLNKVLNALGQGAESIYG